MNALQDEIHRAVVEAVKPLDEKLQAILTRQCVFSWCPRRESDTVSKQVLARFLRNFFVCSRGIA